MPDARGCFIGEEVTGRCFEELQHFRVLPGRGVCYIDNDGGALQGIGEALARNAIDAGAGRGSQGFVPLIAKLLHELRSNEPSSADYYDFHECPSLSAAAFPSSRSQ